MHDTIGDTRAELVIRRDLTIAAIAALDTLVACYDRDRADLVEPRATKPARKAVAPAPVAAKPARATQAAPAMPVPMGRVRGPVLLALRSRVTATTREIAADRGCTIACASSAIQALAKQGYCTRAGKVWKAVPQKASTPDTGLEVLWNGAKDGPSLIGDRPSKGTR